MAITQLIFRKGNFIGEIELDAILNESASTAARITKNPVENGADINDHIIIDPMSFSVSGVVSNVSSNIIQAVSTIPSIFANKTKSQIAWDELLELQANRQPFTLVQGLKTYNNVVIQSLSESQDVNTANALYVNIALRELILGGTEELTATFNDDTISDSMTPTKEGGLKQLAP